MQLDPLTFATLVGLLGDFVTHRKANSSADMAEFIAWLAEHRHEEVINALQTTAGATISTKALLGETREVLLGKLGVLEKALAEFAGTVDGVASIAKAFLPDGGLSSQAISILRQIDTANASKVLMHITTEGAFLAFLDGDINGHIELTDLRFLEDDLRTLVELGLLRPDVNSNRDRFFHFTRRAANLLEPTV